LVRTGHALPHRADQEGRQNPARPPRTHPQLFPRQKNIVEGLNNKAKLTMRKAYGFRTFRITEIALYHALGKLPEPHAAHRFY
jgi:hypothetical protein